MSGAWWRNAIFYEVYVRSFADSNDDGIGDLPGITSRFDYLSRLGVDGIWLTPFYPSPQKDHGYDVADYCDVNPEYGTLDDFDALISRAHELRIKVLVDLVPNHTSDQHPWFVDALSSADNSSRSRYHFADAKPDGSPPNNWPSVFGGSAWKKDEASGQSFLHLFAPEQPDLNWWNPEVPEEFRRVFRFWLDRGADGFRIDVAPSLYKRKDLADVPAGRRAFGWIVNQPEVHDVYRDWRSITRSYEPERVLAGEAFEPAFHADFVSHDQLQMAFAMMPKRWDADVWRRRIDVYMRAVSRSAQGPTWSLSNHDVTRHATRLGGGSVGRARARSALLLLLGLPGRPFLYQGEELGLEEAPIPDEMRQDPVFFNTGGRQKGRDGCRVPMPWKTGEPNAGFSTSAPWLPMPQGWDRNAVDAQERATDSMLAFYRRALSIRRRELRNWFNPVRWQPAPRDCLAFSRGRLRVACNFSARTVDLELGGRLLLGTQPGISVRAGRLRLPGNAAAWLDAQL